MPQNSIHNFISRATQQSREKENAERLRRANDPAYGKPVSFNSVDLPPTLLGDQAHGRAIVAKALREIHNDPSYGGDVYGRSRDAGKWLVYAMKLGAFSSPEWAAWRMRVEGFLVGGDEGPTFDVMFANSVMLLKDAAANTGLPLHPCMSDFKSIHPTVAAVWLADLIEQTPVAAAQGKGLPAPMLPKDGDSSAPGGWLTRKEVRKLTGHKNVAEVSRLRNKSPGIVGIKLKDGTVYFEPSSVDTFNANRGMKNWNCRVCGWTSAAPSKSKPKCPGCINIAGVTEISAKRSSNKSRAHA